MSDYENGYRDGLRAARETLVGSPEQIEKRRGSIGRPGMLRHQCGSCDMTDDERAKTDGWNEALLSAANWIATLTPPATSEE